MLFPCFLTAQHSIDLSFSPGFSYRLLKNGDHRDFEKPKFSYHTGINISFALSNKFALKTGIAYQKLGYDGSDIPFMFPNQNNGQGQFDPSVPANEPDFPTTVYPSGNFHFLELPLALRYYYFMDTKFNLFFEAGPALNFFMNEDEQNFYRNSHIFFNTSLGLDFILTEKLRLFSGIFNHLALTSLQKESAVKEKQLNVGLMFGLRLGL